MDQFSYPALSAFVSRNGTDIPEYCFRRCKEVRARVEALRAGDPALQQVPALVYKTLDVNSLLASCSSAEELKKRLIDIDSSWHDIYLNARKLCALGEEQKNRLNAKNEELSALKLQLEESARTAAEMEKELLRHRLYSRSLVRLFETCVYPEVAKRLIRKEIPELELADYINEEEIECLPENPKKTPAVRKEAQEADPLMALLSEP